MDCGHGKPLSEERLHNFGLICATRTCQEYLSKGGPVIPPWAIWILEDANMEGMSTVSLMMVISFHHSEHLGFRDRLFNKKQLTLIRVIWSPLVTQGSTRSGVPRLEVSMPATPKTLRSCVLGIHQSGTICVVI